ncbi:11228_t:CDS:2, partial [Paraglomus occultum]
AAIIARRLNTVAKELDIPGAEAARTRIEKYCEVLEKELLDQFDRAYRKGDAKTMQHCAKTLHEFNGGGSCIALYVNQHSFFIQKVNLTETHEFFDNKSWNDLANPEIAPPPLDKGLANLYQEIRETVKQEAEIINAVFPNPMGVMQVFLQRIFAQLIQSCLEHLLKESESLSTLAYLRTLATIHIATLNLVEDLKGLDMHNKKSEETRGRMEGSQSKADTLVDVLNQCMMDLFVPYTEGDRYLEKEKKSLVELYSSLLLQFNAYHV